jgi:hypothetical protein
VEKSVGKSGSFDFASGLALWVAAKANVPLVRWQKQFKFFLCGGGVLIFFGSVCLFDKSGVEFSIGHKSVCLKSVSLMLALSQNACS